MLSGYIALMNGAETPQTKLRLWVTTALAHTTCFLDDFRADALATPAQKRGYIFAAFSASLVAIALGRFAYTPLLPKMIGAHWFAADDLVNLSNASLIGYLLGALLGRKLACIFGNTPVLRAMGSLATMALAACAFPVSVTWFFVWQTLTGLAGGVTVVLVAATVLPRFPAGERGRVSGMIFLGLGAGVVISGTLLPVLLRYGLRATWLGIAAVCALLNISAWKMWPVAQRPPTLSTLLHTVGNRVSIRMLALMHTQFALVAVGVTPAMLFLSDFVARRFPHEANSSLTWAAYGVGSLLGPMIYGNALDHVKARWVLRAVLTVEAAAAIVLVFLNGLVAVSVLALVIGTFISGVIPIVQGWIRESVPGDQRQQNVIWSQSTVVYAGTSALSGYVFTRMITAGGQSYGSVFFTGGVALALALFINLLDEFLHVSRPKEKAAIGESLRVVS